MEEKSGVVGEADLDDDLDHSVEEEELIAEEVADEEGLNTEEVAEGENLTVEEVAEEENVVDDKIYYDGDGNPFIMILSQYLNVRESPDVDSELLYVLDNYSFYPELIYTVHDVAEDNLDKEWFMIEYEPGEFGWVAGWYTEYTYDYTSMQALVEGFVESRNSEDSEAISEFFKVNDRAIYVEMENLVDLYYMVYGDSKIINVELIGGDFRSRKYELEYEDGKTQHVNCVVYSDGSVTFYENTLKYADTVKWWLDSYIVDLKEEDWNGIVVSSATMGVEQEILYPEYSADWLDEYKKHFDLETMAWKLVDMYDDGYTAVIYGEKDGVYYEHPIEIWTADHMIGHKDDFVFKDVEFYDYSGPGFAPGYEDIEVAENLNKFYKKGDKFEFMIRYLTEAGFDYYIETRDDLKIDYKYLVYLKTVEYENYSVIPFYTDYSNYIGIEVDWTIKGFEGYSDEEAVEYFESLGVYPGLSENRIDYYVIDENGECFEDTEGYYKRLEVDEKEGFKVYEKVNNPYFLDFDKEGISYDFLGFYWNEDSEVFRDFLEFSNEGDFLVDVAVTASELRRYELGSLVRVDYVFRPMGFNDILDKIHNDYYVMEDKVYKVNVEDVDDFDLSEISYEQVVMNGVDMIISDDSHNQKSIEVYDNSETYSYYNEGNSNGEKYEWSSEQGLEYHYMGLGAHQYGYRIFPNVMEVSAAWQEVRDLGKFSDYKVEEIVLSDYVKDNEVVFDTDWMNDDDYYSIVMASYLIDVNKDGIDELYIIERHGSGWFYETKVYVDNGEIYEWIAGVSREVIPYEYMGEIHYIEHNYNFASKRSTGFSEYMFIDDAFFINSGKIYDLSYDHVDLGDVISRVIDVDWLNKFERFETYESNIGIWVDDETYLVEDLSQGISYNFEFYPWHTSVGRYPSYWILDYSGDESMKDIPGYEELISLDNGLCCGFAVKQLDSDEIYAVKASYYGLNLGYGQMVLELYQFTSDEIVKVEELVISGEMIESEFGVVEVVE